MRKCMMMTLALLLLAAPAWAQVDVDLAFDPAEVSPGDEVTLFFSIANLGDEAVLADADLMITAGGMEIGPIMGKLPLPAGYELSKELTLVVPPLPFSGDLTLTLTVTAGEFSDTATATLTLLGGTDGNAADGLADLGTEVMDGIGAEQSSVATEEATVGQLKARF